MTKRTNFKHISMYDMPEQSPGFLLWHVSTLWRSSIEEALKPLELTHPQFVILAALGWLTKDGDLATQSMIGTMAGLDPNTTSQIIRGLEAKGLVKRAQSLTDTRVKNSTLMPKGTKLLAIALPAVEAADTAFFKSVAGQDLESLLKTFQKLAKR